MGGDRFIRGKITSDRLGKADRILSSRSVAEVDGLLSFGAKLNVDRSSLREYTNTKHSRASFKHIHFFESKYHFIGTSKRNFFK